MSENARAWVTSGATVTVVTCAPNYPRGKVFPGYRNRLFQREVIDGVNVIRLWTLVSANEGLFLRTLNYLSLLLSVVIASPWLPRPDVVMSTSPNLFCGIAGGLLSWIKRRPWVLEIRDLWPESIVAVGAIRSRAIIAPFEHLERWAYRKADAVVSVTDTFVRHIVTNGAKREKVHVIKNGVDLRKFAAGDGANFRAKHELTSKIMVSYIGTHGMAHKLETVLMAAAKLEHRPEIVFAMVGDGAERTKLTAMRDKMGLSNVMFLGELPRSDMPDVMAATDISLVVLSNSPLFRAVIPSKIFEAMAASKPIVLGVDGESAEIILEAKSGLVVTPENAEELSAAIQTLADDASLRDELGRNGLNCVRMRFSRQVLSKTYLDLLRRVAAYSRRSPASHPLPQDVKR
nr:glycosyltransferase family 4 protein [Microvirga sp. BSC39]